MEYSATSVCGLTQTHHHLFDFSFTTVKFPPSGELVEVYAPSVCAHGCLTSCCCPPLTSQLVFIFLCPTILKTAQGRKKIGPRSPASNPNGIHPPHHLPWQQSLTSSSSFEFIIKILLQRLSLRDFHYQQDNVLGSITVNRKCTVGTFSQVPYQVQIRCTRPLHFPAVVAVVTTYFENEEFNTT